MPDLHRTKVVYSNYLTPKLNFQSKKKTKRREETKEKERNIKWNLL